jgi:hypothetical protein
MELVWIKHMAAITFKDCVHHAKLPSILTLKHKVALSMAANNTFWEDVKHASKTTFWYTITANFQTVLFLQMVFANNVILIILWKMIALVWIRMSSVSSLTIRQEIVFNVLLNTSCLNCNTNVWPDNLAAFTIARINVAVVLLPSRYLHKTIVAIYQAVYNMMETIAQNASILFSWLRVFAIFKIASQVTTRLVYPAKVPMCWRMQFVFYKIRDALFLTVQLENAKLAKVVIKLLQQDASLTLKTANHGLLWEIAKIVKDYTSWIHYLNANSRILIV